MMNCPMPIYSGTAGNVTFVSYFSFNYTVFTQAGNKTGTFFQCLLFFNQVNHPSLSLIQKEYGKTEFNVIPVGQLLYTGDVFYIAFQRVQAFFELVSLFVTPIQFNILGFTINDIGGLAVMLVIAVYALCYIAIGGMIYKLISPFGGGI